MMVSTAAMKCMNQIRLKLSHYELCVEAHEVISYDLMCMVHDHTPQFNVTCSMKSKVSYLHMHAHVLIYIDDLKHSAG